MGLRSLVSFGLFILPVAVTLGLLLGLDRARHSSGQKSIFAPAPNNKVTTDVFCQLSYGFTPDPGRYTFNPNQWGVTNDESSLCMNVTYYENGTYPTKTVGPKFTATWQYDQGPESQPVHAFPNAKIEINEIVNASTVQLSNLTSMPVDIAWTYGSGDVVASTLDTSGLSDLELNSNVCFDMFLDSDPDKAITTDNSTYEVMIWLGQFGLSTQPIGNTLGVKATKVVNETTFDLYDGENSNTGQKVFTWLAEGNTTDFVGNIGLLLDELSSYGGPTTSDYLGYIAFGSEALYVTKNVTFSVSELSLDLQTS